MVLDIRICLLIMLNIPLHSLGNNDIITKFNLEQFVRMLCRGKHKQCDTNFSMPAFFMAQWAKPAADVQGHVVFSVIPNTRRKDLHNFSQPHLDARCIKKRGCLELSKLQHFLRNTTKERRNPIVFLFLC